GTAAGRRPRARVSERRRTASAPHNPGGWLARRAATSGARVAVVEGVRALDYAALDTRAARFAGWLRAAGVGRRDRVAVAPANRSAFSEAVFTAARIRAIPLPLSSRLAAPQLPA